MIKNWAWKKLKAWKGILFSIGGWEALIKAVALAVPTYTVVIFWILAILCDDLHAMIARFWWDGGGDKKKKRKSYTCGLGRNCVRPK